MTEPSEKYFEALRLTRGHHARQNKTFSGQFTWKQRKRIKDVIDRFGCKTILDFGCGKGKQYNAAVNRDEHGLSLEQFWGIKPTLYDPGVKAFGADPVGKFDLVICVQVLGSIPTVDLPLVIDRLYQFADKAIFVAERIAAPRKGIFDSMRSAMPHGMALDGWMTLLRWPGSPIRLVGAFRNVDEATGWRGWKIVEPEDQG